ncbi:MAG: hypothetical protein BAJATHORv1_50207 [Candidatus Thorarchaeota archaeon]|nr:MAG: hypothetical protein BAJATHORv1_50207 [Candidatus Thorarchaeota archaeon]
MGRKEISSDMLERWLEDIQDTIKQRFNIATKAPPKIVVKDELENSLDSLWNITFDDNIVEIPKIIEDDKQFIRAVLARELFFQSIQSHVTNHEAAFHLSAAFAIEYLDDPSDWFSIWENKCPLTATSRRTWYCPSMTFRLLQKLSDGDYLDELMDSILLMSRYGIKFSDEDWKLFLHRFLRNYSTPLTSAEITIVDALMRNPDSTKADIAERANISPVWVSTLIAAMKKRHQLREFESIVFSRVGIRVFQIVLEPKNATQNDCEKSLQWCPYLYTSNAIVTGKRGLFATLAIPDNPQNIRDLHKFIQIVKQSGILINVFERNRSARIFNLGTYEPNEGIWKIDWNAISLEADLLQRDEWAPVFPLVTQDAPKRAKLDKRDVRLLSAFQKGFRTIRELRAEIRGRSADITSRLNRLRSEDVIRRIWEIHHIGLNEGGLVVSNDSKTSSICAALSLRLPLAYVDFDTQDRLLMRTFLPQGGINGFARSLANLSPPPEIHVLGQRYHGAYRIEKWIDDWDPETAAWMPTKIDRSEWFDCLEALIS